MIIKGEIISQPNSGEFPERIYDNNSPWNSNNWTCVKFTENNYSEWCGQFRGFPRQVSVSEKHNICLVLTSDYLFQLNLLTGNLMKFEDQPQYYNLSVSPNGDFIISDSFQIEKIGNDINKKELIISPIQMDFIKFNGWQNNIMEFTCDEFLNWNKHLVMEYDSNRNDIKIKKIN